MGVYKPSIFTYKPQMYADEWAEQRVVLKDTGRFRFDVTPFFREPCRYASDTATTSRVVIKCCAQLGKTQSILNIIGWMTEYDPSNSLLILDSLKTGQRMSKNRLKPFLRDICNIDAFNKAAKDKSKETTNLSLGTGANLIIGSASSASDLCSTPVKWLFADELDRWTDELDGEGDPLLLAFKRQMRFRGMAVLTSTPTTATGRIQQHYLLGTQQTWSAQCECGYLMRVSYDDIVWDDTPTYSCPVCGTVYDESAIKLLPHRYTSPQNKTPFFDKYGRVARSYEITATLCHQQYSWDALKREEMQAKALGEAAVRSFRNTTLGEVYTPPEQEIIQTSALTRLGNHYTLESVPAFVDYVVAGIDTQDNAFPYLICGFSRDCKKCALLKASVILGDLRTQAPWEALKNILNSFSCKTEDGRTLHIMLASIDSGGHHTQDIYALSMLSPRIRAVKGRSTYGKMQEKSIIHNVVRAQVKAVGSGIGKTDLTFINTVFCKDLIYAHLNAKAHGLSLGGDWVWSVSKELGIDDNFFEQLTSEVKSINKKGVVSYEKLPNKDNHFLDCLVYCLASAEVLRLAQGAIPVLQAPAEPEPQPSVQEVQPVQENKQEDTPTPLSIKKKEIVPVKRRLKML